MSSSPSSSVLLLLALTASSGIEQGSCFQDDGNHKDIFNEMDDPHKNWEQRCLNTAGQTALDDWLKAQENLLYCVLANFDSKKIENEIEQKRETGEDLSPVFEKYCGEPVAKTRPCIIAFFETSRRCLPSNDKIGLNITVNMLDAAIDFLCHRGGDRLSLFMAFDGMSCLQSHREAIFNCIKHEIPEMFEDNTLKNADLLTFDHDNCRKFDAIRKCVDHNLKGCGDAKPSDIIDSMLMAVRKATPCEQVSSRWFTATSGSPPAHSSITPRTQTASLGWFVTIFGLNVKFSISQ